MPPRPPRTPRSTLPLLACAAFALALAPPAGAADDVLPPRLQRPNALRAGYRLHAGGFGGQLWDAAGDLTYARQLTRVLALEASGGVGRGGLRRGENVGAGVRLTLGSHGPHALTVATSGRVTFLRDYGPVAFGSAEAAWELRTSGGFDLLVGGGLGMVLTTSRSVDPRCVDQPGEWFRCYHSRFHAGEAGLWLRAEAGFAF